MEPIIIGSGNTTWDKLVRYNIAEFCEKVSSPSGKKEWKHGFSSLRRIAHSIGKGMLLHRSTFFMDATEGIRNGDKLAVITIHRAAQWMIRGMMDSYSYARHGDLVLQRDKKSPELTHCHLISVPEIPGIYVIGELAGATGGTSDTAVDILKNTIGVDEKRIKLMIAFISPEFVRKITIKYPEVQIYYGMKVHGLNQHKYLVDEKGEEVIGDAGNRLAGIGFD